jgi:hypothetical protein
MLHMVTIAGLDRLQAQLKWEGCLGPVNLDAPFGWADLPIPPPHWVVDDRWTRTAVRLFLQPVCVSWTPVGRLGIIGVCHNSPASLDRNVVKC